MPMPTIDQIKADILAAPIVESAFAVGDRVTFTNENGAAFHGLRVMGFDDGTHICFKYGRHIYLEKASYWFPVKESELTKE